VGHGLRTAFDISESDETGCPRRGCFSSFVLWEQWSRSTLALARPISRDVPNYRTAIGPVDRATGSHGDFCADGGHLSANNHPHPNRQPRASHAYADGNGDDDGNVHDDSDRDPSTNRARGADGHRDSHTSAGHAYSHADSRPNRSRNTHLEQCEFNASVVVVAHRRNCAGRHHRQRVPDPQKQPEASMGGPVVLLGGRRGVVRP
jgi:hypothetical protein